MNDACVLPPDDTLIRVAEWRRRGLWLITGILILFAVCVVFYAIGSGQPAALIMAGGYGSFAACIARGALGGIVLTSEGVKARGAWRTYRWRWREIERFELREKGEMPRFRVHLKDGAVHGFLGFYAGTSKEEERAQALFRALEKRLQMEKASREDG